jgi:methyltransferase
MRPWYPCLWLGLLIQRLVELRRSRANTKGQAGPAGDPAGFPVMVGLHMALFLVPPLESTLMTRHRRGRGVWALVLLTAAALRVWSIRSLGPQWNVRALVRADFHPVTSGPYRFIRHPNYLAVALECAALPMAAGAWRSALGLSLVNGWVLARRIRAEEALLFKDARYRSEFGSKARFIPRVL